MSAEYSVGEVRDIANKQRATMPYTAAMLTSYADLLERIKADEGVVTDEIVRAACRAMHPTAEFSDSMNRTAQEGMRAALFAVWPNPPAQAAQLWEMKQRACRAHALCNELRLAHPEIPELGDDGVLHEAIHDILRVDTPTAEPAQAAPVDGWKPSNDEVHAWRDRNDMDVYSLADCRTAIDDARSMHVLSALIAEPVAQSARECVEMALREPNAAKAAQVASELGAVRRAAQPRAVSTITARVVGMTPGMALIELKLPDYVPEWADVGHSVVLAAASPGESA